MKTLFMTLALCLLISCGDEITSVPQQPEKTCISYNLSLHCKTMPPVPANTSTSEYFNVSQEDLDKMRADVERINEIGLTECSIDNLSCAMYEGDE